MDNTIVREMKAGSELCRKHNKNKYEVQATKAFKKFILWLTVPLLAYIVIGGVLVGNFGRSINGGRSEYASYNKRTGHVEDGKIRYVQGENKYISFEKLNLSPEEVKEGDDVVLFFDTTSDELVFAKKQKEYDVRANITVVAIYSSPIIFLIHYVINGIIGEKYLFLDFHRWYRETYNS